MTLYTKLAIVLFLAFSEKACAEEVVADGKAVFNKVYTIVFIDNTFTKENVLELVAMIDKESKEKSLIYGNIFEPANRQVRTTMGYMIAVDTESALKFYSLMLEMRRKRDHPAAHHGVP